MKKLLLLVIACLLCGGLFAQNDERSELLKKLEEAKISLEFKALAKPVLHNQEEDCKPPPCSGIIDPWTCECFDDIKDPWEDEAVAFRMKEVLQLEAAMLKGKGGKLLPRGLVSEARKQHPGKTPEAIHSRAHFYADALK